MESCKNCKHAKWDRTEAGDLHPSGDGRCSWQMPVILVPKAFHPMDQIQPDGGHISRKTPETDCPCWD